MPEPKVLVANRGEIAVRIIRTCREMGIPTVAVYSDADRDALHVEMADEAYHVGAAPSVESYLNVGRILEAATRSRATLVHPGYGFLAENADFARAVARAGLTFVGPPPEAMALMGDKAMARRTAEEAGAPTIPGTRDPIAPANAPSAAERTGFPLVVKAAFGGGGKGMRLVEDQASLGDAVERSSREAAAYFGRPEVYLERYLLRAHHVEAQVIADTHGNYSFLGERDCSLQRRYQKLVEESPSPVVDEGLRTKIGDAALAIARAAGYVNAGTVEFLVEEDGAFYFIEANARLQVEHPVTEMVAGVDLVRHQIEVSLGERVDLEPLLRGHAIECRLNAEDPGRDFLPGPGPVTRLRPPGGPFVRLDAGVREGGRVVGDYDSMFGKLIVWAEDRSQATRRMLRALDELEVEGIPTTIPFHRWVLETDEFRRATIHTKWVEDVLEEGRFAPPAGESSPAPSTAPGERPVRLVAEVGGHRIPVALWGEELPTPPTPPRPAGHHHHGGPGDVIVAPMQGTILAVAVAEGQEVEAGDTVCVLEAMKMENHIIAPREGTVVHLAVSKGDVVEIGQALATIE